MIQNAEELMLGAGYPEEHIKKELYSPKGKTVTANVIRAAAAGLAAG
jgi:hypothetical protein